MITNLINLNHIRKLSTTKLIALAEKMNVNIESTHAKEIVSSIISHGIKNNIVIEMEGVLEIINKYGFLRYECSNYIASPEDVFLNEQIIKSLNLRTGDIIKCDLKMGENNKNFNTDANLIKSVNGQSKEKAKTRPAFEKLTAIHPCRRIYFAKPKGKETFKELRLLDLFTPMGFGQRALIVAPPKTGKTTLMKRIAQSILSEHKDIHLMILLIGERPEEVTDMHRSVLGATVLSSTFDEPPSKHIHVADIALERAKRLVEMKQDVILLVDSLTRFSRSNNCVVPSSNKVLTGGLDITALHKPKQFFGAARQLDEGGSLTIIATILVETGSKAEDVIYEEFQGTSNSVVLLSRSIAEARKFPAIDIIKSSTRKDELLLNEIELNIANLLRMSFATMNPVDVLSRMLKRIETSENNEEILKVNNSV